MKLNLIKSLAVAAVIGAVASAHAGVWAYLQNGYNYTNATVVANNTTWQIGTVAGLGTNTFNTFIGASGGSGASYVISGSQANTNLLPVYAINLAPSYPETIYGPINNLAIYTQINFQKTNAPGTGLVTFRYAGSIDGTNPVTSYFTQTISIPANTSQGVGLTNFTTGALPYLLLQTEENTNGQAITNIVIEVGGKSGGI